MGRAPSMEQLAKLARAGRSPAGPLPSFVLIGGMKCGTTTLYDYLCRHDGVFPGVMKEPCFFADDRWHDLGEPLYRSLFAGARPDQICGEASTPYSRRENGLVVPARMHAMIPDARIVYLVRHPVDRAYSHHRHYMRKAERTTTFEEALERSDEYIDAGMYLKHAERYLEHYPRSSLLILLFEDLRRDPGAVLSEVQRFLGLAETDLLADGSIHANDASANWALRRATVHRIRRNRVLRGLSQATPQPVRRFAYGLLERTPYARRVRQERTVPPMLPETRRRLLDVYAEPNRRLAEFLGRDLSAWSE